MADQSFIRWPFFEQRHRDHLIALRRWCADHADRLHEESGNLDADCRRLVRLLGDAGHLRHAVPAA